MDSQSHENEEVSNQADDDYQPLTFHGSAVHSVRQMIAQAEQLREERKNATTRTKKQYLTKKIDKLNNQTIAMLTVADQLNPVNKPSGVQKDGE